jgi:hypothetical protein
MEKDHFEILLEEMKSNFRLAFEGLDGVNGRLDRIEAWQTGADGRFDNLETGQEAIKAELRDMRRNQGLLNSIANDHESRLQGVESTLKDHLDNHS